MRLPRYGHQVMEADDRIVVLTGYAVRSSSWALPAGPFAGPSGVRRRRRVVDQADRTISTGKLHVLPRFHTRPIDVVVFHGSQRDLVLRGASRLDAFSGYPVRT